MNAVVNSAEKRDFHVADLSLADWGRKEMAIAETEMPGLMAIRREFETEKPLAGARIAGSLHMTIQTAMLIDTLKALGADVRWAAGSMNPAVSPTSTQPLPNIRSEINW